MLYEVITGVMGAGITVILNYLWIPTLGYVGSAWATLACYAAMMLASYLLGQKHYPIPYHLSRVFTYLASAIVLYLITVFLPEMTTTVKYSIHTLFFISFLALIFLLEIKRNNFV